MDFSLLRAADERFAWCGGERGVAHRASLRQELRPGVTGLGRMTISYDPGSQSVSFIVQWRGTIFPLVLSDPLFWTLFILHIVLLTYQNLEMAAGRDGLPPLDWNAASVSMGLLTFFVIFYGNHCYTRYFELFGQCIGIGRILTVWAFMVKSTFSHCTPQRRWNIMRPMLAGMCIHYSIVYTDDDEDGKGVSKSEWQAIQEQNLLSQDECDQLDVYQGPLPTLCATWALDEVKAALVQDQLDSDPRQDLLETRVAAKTGQLVSQPRLTVYNRFEDLAREFTGLTGATMELLSQPVPFPYFHVLKILLLVALAILGYALIDLLEAHVLLSPSVYAVHMHMHARGSRPTPPLRLRGTYT